MASHLSMPTDVGTVQSTSAARAMRIAKVRETSISPTALFDKRCRGLYSLEPIDTSKFKARSKADQGSLPAPTVDPSVTSHDRFDEQSPGESEVGGLIWEYMEGAVTSQDASRRVLQPHLHKAFARMNHSDRKEVAQRVQKKACQKMEQMRQRSEKIKSSLDKRGVFHPNANAQRAHTMEVSTLLSKLDRHEIENEVLQEIIAERAQKDKDDFLSLHQMSRMNTQESAQSRAFTRSLTQPHLNTPHTLKHSLTQARLHTQPSHPSSSRSRASSASSDQSRPHTSHDPTSTPHDPALHNHLSHANSRGSSPHASRPSSPVVADTPPLVLSRSTRSLSSKLLHDPSIQRLHVDQDERYVADMTTFFGARLHDQPAPSSHERPLTAVQQLMQEDSRFREYSKLTSSYANVTSHPRTRALKGSQISSPVIRQILSTNQLDKRTLIGEDVHRLSKSQGFPNPHIESGKPEVHPAFEFDELSSHASDDLSHSSTSPSQSHLHTKHTGLLVDDETSESVVSTHSQSEGHKHTTHTPHRDEKESRALQEKLVNIWNRLVYPMHQKLELLQKYSSLEHAPKLRDVIEIWEVAATVIPLREKSLDYLHRLNGGEVLYPDDMFTREEKHELVSLGGVWVNTPRINMAYADPSQADQVLSDNSQITKGWLTAILEGLTAVTKSSIEQLKIKFKETVTYRGENYSKKLRADS